MLLVSCAAWCGQVVASGKADASPSKFEDDTVEVPIPPGWTRAAGDHPASIPVLDSPGSLLLEKAGYTLTLAFRAEHTSGIAGGRFVEAFRIPWLSIEDGWNCSLKLTEVPQPASRTL